jgi:hypothetical protein
MTSFFMSNIINLKYSKFIVINNKNVFDRSGVTQKYIRKHYILIN